MSKRLQNVYSAPARQKGKEFSKCQTATLTSRSVWMGVDGGFGAWSKSEIWSKILFSHFLTYDVIYAHAQSAHYKIDIFKCHPSVRTHVALLYVRTNACLIWKRHPFGGFPLKRQSLRYGNKCELLSCPWELFLSLWQIKKLPSFCL